MPESLDFVLRPVLAIARVVLWLAWDLCLEIIGWSIGWVVCRTLTFGHWPKAKYSEMATLDSTEALVVELIGLGTLALLIAVLSGLLGEG
jgi:hypothetical protein